MTQLPISGFVFLCLLCLSFAIPTPADVSLSEISVSQNGLDTDFRAISDPPGLEYAHYSNERPIDTLVTENVIVQVMALLAQRDPDTDVPGGVVQVESSPDVVVNFIPEPGQPFKPKYVIWALASALGWLVNTHKDNFAVTFTRIQLYGHTIGYVEILKVGSDLQSDMTSAANLTGASVATNITMSSAVAAKISKKTRRSNPISERDALSNSTTTGIEETSRSKIHDTTVGDFAADITYLASLYNFGRDNLYQTLANAVLGLVEPGFDLRRDRFLIRNASFRTRLTIVPTNPSRQPYNTKNYSLQTIIVISSFVASQRRYNPLEADGKVDGTIIHTLRIVEYLSFGQR